MENTIWFLESCDTCRRILKEIGQSIGGFNLREIKRLPILQEELDYLVHRTGSSIALLNTRARKLQSPDYKGLEITETLARNLILEDYTFLKRPVFLIEGKVYAGNSPTVISAVKTSLGI